MADVSPGNGSPWKTQKQESKGETIKDLLPHQMFPVLVNRKNAYNNPNKK
jgi:hypothetical protein